MNNYEQILVVKFIARQTNIKLRICLEENGTFPDRSAGLLPQASTVFKINVFFSTYIDIHNIYY